MEKYICSLYLSMFLPSTTLFIFSCRSELSSDVTYLKTERLIYFKALLVGMNSLNLCLPLNVFIFLYFWWEFYYIYVLGWQVFIFSLSTLENTSCCLLDSIVSDEKQAINHVVVSLYIISHFSLAAFNFFIYLSFGSLTTTCSDVSLSLSHLKYFQVLGSV